MDSSLTTAVDSSPAAASRRVPESTKTPSRALIFLLATTAGLVVMNIYYNQPVLNAIAVSLHINSAAVAWVSTVTQLGVRDRSAFFAADR